MVPENMTGFLQRNQDGRIASALAARRQWRKAATSKILGEFSIHLTSRPVRGQREDIFGHVFKFDRPRTLSREATSKKSATKNRGVNRGRITRKNWASNEPGRQPEGDSEGRSQVSSFAASTGAPSPDWLPGALGNELEKPSKAFQHLR